MAANFTWQGETAFAGDASPIDLTLAFDGLAVLGVDDLATAAVASDEYDAVGAVVIYSDAVVTDERVFSVEADTTELVFSDGAAIPGSAMQVTVETGAVASEETSPGAYQFVDDLTTATDEREAAVSFDLTEAATVDEVVLFGPQEVTATSEAAAFGNMLNVFEQTEETAASGDEVLTFSVALSTESEAVVTSEQETTGYPVAAIVETSAVADDVLAVSVTATDTVIDDATATDEQFYKRPGAVAWVMNTETTAASWYSNWQFIDVVQDGDTIYAVGPEGVSTLGGNTDNGETIDARVKYGWMDFGMQQKKRVAQFWFGYTSDDIMQMDVETYGQGDAMYTYEMPRRGADQPRNNRIMPGKGLLSRYWSLTIRNVGGADFTVNESSADVTPASRRL